MERYYLEDISIDGGIILKMFFKKRNGETLPRLLWLRLGTDSRRL